MQARASLSRLQVNRRRRSDALFSFGAQPQPLGHQEAVDGVQQTHRRRLDRHSVVLRPDEPHTEAEHLPRRFAVGVGNS